MKNASTSTNYTDARIISHIRANLIPSIRETIAWLESLDGTGTQPQMQQLLGCLRELVQDLDLAPSRRTTMFWTRVLKDGHHLIWTGAGQGAPDGPPICEWDGRRTTAAKVAWLLLTGRPVPDGQRLRRTCERKRCIAPGCHSVGVTGAVAGRVSGRRYNDNGQPTCHRGHVLRREPRPRETVYCSQCYQIDKHGSRSRWEDLSANQPHPDIQPPANSFRREYGSTLPADAFRYPIPRAQVEAEEQAQRVERGLPVDPPPTPTFDQARLDAELAALFDLPAWQPAKPPAPQAPNDDDDTPRLPD